MLTVKSGISPHISRYISGRRTRPLDWAATRSYRMKMLSADKARTGINQAFYTWVKSKLNHDGQLTQDKIKPQAMHGLIGYISLVEPNADPMTDFRFRLRSASVENVTSAHVSKWASAFMPKYLVKEHCHIANQVVAKGVPLLASRPGVLDDGTLVIGETLTCPVYDTQGCLVYLAGTFMLYCDAPACDAWPQN